LIYATSRKPDSFAETICILIGAKDHTFAKGGDLYCMLTVNLYEYDGEAKVPEFSAVFNNNAKTFGSSAL
jgi:hypothetical protein